MTESVNVSIVSGLKGSANSNPEIYRIYPNVLNIPKDDILHCSLPFGSKPDNFYLTNLGGDKILTYVFELNNQSDRNDLISLGFVLGKKSITDNLKEVVRALINRMREENILTLDILEQNLDKILTGLKKESKISIQKMVFDVQFFLKAQKIKISKDDRKVRGKMI